MTTPEHELDPFIEALRSDLPSEAADTRVRARLMAAGIGVGAAVTLSATAAGAPAAAATGAKAGVLSKLVALPLAAKIGAATVVVAATTVPVATYVVSRDSASVAEVRRSNAPVSQEIGQAQSVAPAAEVAEAPTDESDDTGRENAPQPVESSPMDRPSRSAVLSVPATPAEPERLGGSEPSAPVPVAESVGSFPEVDTPSPSSTLRAETALVERALQAIRAGDLGVAHALLEEHRRTYPHGLLVRERERAFERLRDAHAHGGTAPAR